MKPNSELPTYNLPDHILREYQALQQSKDQFLKSLMPAEQRKLETLYDQLEDAIAANNTPKLKAEFNGLLKKKPENLKNLKEDEKSFEIQYEKEFIRSMNMKKQNSLNFKKESQEDIMNWKDDIIEREESLKASKKRFIEILTQNSEQKNGLKKEEKKLLEIFEVQRSISKDLEEASKMSLEIELPYQQDLDDKKKNWKKSLELKSLELKGIKKKHNSKDSNYTKELRVLERSLNRSLLHYEKNLTQQLETEIWKELKESSEHYTHFFKKGNESQALKTLKLLSTEHEKLTNALNRGLGKAGLNEDWFWDNFNKTNLDSSGS